MRKAPAVSARSASATAAGCAMRWPSPTPILPPRCRSTAASAAVEMVPRIEARAHGCHYGAGLDDCGSNNEGWEPYAAALEDTGKESASTFYPEREPRSTTTPTPRYDEEAATLAWEPYARVSSKNTVSRDAARGGGRSPVAPAFARLAVKALFTLFEPACRPCILVDEVEHEAGGMFVAASDLPRRCSNEPAPGSRCAASSRRSPGQRSSAARTGRGAEMFVLLALATFTATEVIAPISTATPRT